MEAMANRIHRLRGACLCGIIIATITAFSGTQQAIASPTAWGPDVTFAASGDRVTPLAPVTQSDTGVLDLDTAADGRTALISANGLELFTATGASDFGFNANSVIALSPPFPIYGLPDEVEFQSTGKPIVANADVITRLNLNGTKDTSFGTNGSLTEPASALPGFTVTQLSVDNQDRIIVGRGSNASGFAFIRYTSNGQLGSSFATNGVLTLPESVAPRAFSPSSEDGLTSLPRLIRGFFPDGSFIASFYNPFYMSKISSGGSFDSTFGSSGSLTVVPSHRPLPAPGAWNIAGQPDGTFITAGAFEYFKSTVILIASWSSTGRVWERQQTSGVFPTVLSERNGWITVGGPSRSAANTYGFVRFNRSGTPESEFSSGPQSVAPGCNVFETTLTSAFCASKSTTTPAQLRVQRFNGPAPTRPNGDVTFDTVDLLSPTSVRVRWNDEAGDESGYLVYRVANGISTLVTSCPFTQPNLTQCVDTGLTPNTYYSYFVYAWNANGATSPGTGMLTRTPSTAPSAPTVIAAVATSPNAARIDWQDNSSNEDGFKVYRYRNDGTYSLEATTAPNATSAAVANSAIDTSTSIVFVVSAFNSGGETNALDYTFSLSRSTPGGAGPTPPTYLSPIVTGTAVTIRWADNATNEAGYLLYRVEGATSTLVPGCPISTPDLTSCVDTGRTPGTFYQYYLYAWNNAGASYPGTAILVHTPKPLPAPVMTAAFDEQNTRDLSGVANNQESPITLRWQDNATDETEYRVYEYVRGSYVLQFGGTLPSNSTTLTVYPTVGFPGGMPTTHLYVVAVVRGTDVTYAPYPMWATTRI
jgi:hypothetical protein